MRARAVVAVVVAVCGLVGLAGCAGWASGPTGASGNQSADGSGSKTAGATLTGKERGGQQPIAGAHVYLFAANTMGYGGNGIAASSTNASVSLLTNGINTLITPVGDPLAGDYYVTTGSDGSFTITGDYTCTAGQQVYLYALGGDPGAGANAAAGLMAALGACPAAGNFAAATPYIVINEVSTVAAAYAFAGFATDATHVSNSGTALAQTGIANAFANARNLETLSTGLALATTPAGNGTVPQTEINTLANILASCVNTNGASSTSCTTLFANALAAGATGAQPSDTATAAINIAHNPGTNVATLYALAGGAPPFAPGLSAAPNDWTVGVNFTGGGMGTYTPTAVAVDGQGAVWVMSGPLTKLSSMGAALSPSAGFLGWSGATTGKVGKQLAIDTGGDAWILLSGRIDEFSTSGTLLSPTNGFTGGGIGITPTAFALDGVGEIWIANGSSGTASKFLEDGSALSPSGGYVTGGQLGGIGIDGTRHVWISNVSGAGLLELTNDDLVNGIPSSGALLSPIGGYTGGGLSGFQSNLVVDASGNIWILGSNSIFEFSHAGAPLSPFLGFTGGGLSTVQDLAVDGAGNVWVANFSGTVSELSNSGATLSPSTGFASAALYQPRGVAIDGAGNVWVTNGKSSVNELVGCAVPVVTPVAAGLQGYSTDGSSNLGTRP